MDYGPGIVYGLPWKFQLYVCMYMLRLVTSVCIIK